MENGPLIGPVTFAPLEQSVTYLRSLNDDVGDDDDDDSLR